MWFYALTATSIKNTAFWEVLLCTSLATYQCNVLNDPAASIFCYDEDGGSRFFKCWHLLSNIFHKSQGDFYFLI